MGPHGSGMMNMIWAPKGAVVIEFIPFDATPSANGKGFIDLFDAMSAALGHRYCAVAIADKSGDWKTNTMSVPKDAFAKALVECVT